MATVTTDAKGRASFEFTPVPSDTFDTIDFSASASVDGMPVACEGSVVVGTMPLEVSTSIADSLALLHYVLRAIDVEEEYPDQYEQFFQEIVQVLFKKQKLSGLRGELLQYRPVIGAIANAEPARLTQANVEEIERALDFLQPEVSRGLRGAINRLRNYLQSPELLASFGITIENSVVKNQGRLPTTRIQAKNYQATRARKPASPRSQLQPNYGKLQLSFEANQGQTDSWVRYLVRGPGYHLYLTAQELVLVGEAPAVSTTSKSAFLRMQFVGGLARPTLTGKEKLPGKTNYLIGHDPGRWQTNVPHYRRVQYEDVYPGVDVVYHGKQGQLACDIVVAPGTDPKDIVLAFKGAKRLARDKRGGSDPPYDRR